MRFSKLHTHRVIAATKLDPGRPICRTDSGRLHGRVVRRVLCLDQRSRRSPFRLVKRLCLFLSCFVHSTTAIRIGRGKDVQGFCVGRTLSCVRRGFRGSVSMRSVSTFYKLGEDCFKGVFRSAVKHSPRRFLVDCHVAGTARLLGVASLSVTSVKGTMKCPGRLRFSHTFGGICKMSPEG